jgi:hypothetical protein
VPFENMKANAAPIQNKKFDKEEERKDATQK